MKQKERRTRTNKFIPFRITLMQSSVITNISFVFIFLLAAVFSIAQNGNAKIDLQKSSVHWLATKVFGEHSGTIKLKDASLSMKEGKVTGGNFTIDMNTIACTNIDDAETNAKFINHISSGDFFEVEKYPTAFLKITKVTGKSIIGDLTIHGITKSISFDYEIEKLTDATNKISAKIVIDRTKYDIKYGSKSFFKSIADKAIDDLFTLNVTLYTLK